VCDEGIHLGNSTKGNILASPLIALVFSEMVDHVPLHERRNRPRRVASTPAEDAKCRIAAFRESGGVNVLASSQSGQAASGSIRDSVGRGSGRMKATERMTGRFRPSHGMKFAFGLTLGFAYDERQRSFCRGPASDERDCIAGQTWRRLCTVGSVIAVQYS
jgi:hypothetical protein